MCGKHFVVCTKAKTIYEKDKKTHGQRKSKIITFKAASRMGMTRANSASVSALIMADASAFSLAAASSTMTTAFTLFASTVSLSIT